MSNSSPEQMPSSQYAPTVGWTLDPSPEFMKARLAFAEWYDSKPKEIQELIDSISDRTYFITEEHEYDEFIELLSDYGIETSEQFEDAFAAEYEGYGERIYAEFAEYMTDEVLGEVDEVPEIFRNAIDFELVYYNQLQYDFIDFQFRENTFFFHRNF